MASALELALQLTEQSVRDPVAAVQIAEKTVALLRRVRSDVAANTNAQHGARSDDRLVSILERLERLAAESSRTLAALGVTHIVRPDGLPELTQARRESGPHKIEWPAGTGLVRSLFAGTLDGDPLNLSRVSVRITRDTGTDDLGTTGEGAAYLPLLAFHATNHNWFRLEDLPLNSLQRWSASFKYEGAASGPPSVTPFLLFGFARR